MEPIQERASRGVKLCSRCENEQPLSSFRKDSNRLDGLYPWCSDCTRKYYGTQAKQAASLSKNEYNRRRYQALKEMAPVELSAQHRATHLRNTFSMTGEEYSSMLRAQGGRCAICQRTPEGVGIGEGGKARALAVDHDHSCCPDKRSCGGCVRGLLCHYCNVALGSFQDDAHRLTQAMAYLDRWEREGQWWKDQA